MRINAFVARASGISRRAADRAIANNQVLVDGKLPQIGTQVTSENIVMLDGKPLSLPDQTTAIILNKPIGYVCSRDGQGSATIYDLLPPEYHNLKPVGRLDKDSSGLLLLTNDGQLANQLTHPRYVKTKVYEVTLNKPLRAEDKTRVEEGVKLNDGISKLQIKNLSGQSFTVTMSEGRNRQIRRTFDALGYEVSKLHRARFGDYILGDLPLGQIKTL